MLNTLLGLWAVDKLFSSKKENIDYDNMQFQNKVERHSFLKRERDKILLNLPHKHLDPIFNFSRSEGRYSFLYSKAPLSEVDIKNENILIGDLVYSNSVITMNDGKVFSANTLYEIGDIVIHPQVGHLLQINNIGYPHTLWSGFHFAENGCANYFILAIKVLTEEMDALLKRN